MYLGLLLLGVIVLGVEPIVIGALIPHLSLTTILVSIGGFNCALFLFAAFLYQLVAKEDEKVSKTPIAPYVFFPAFILLTLSIDFYLVYATNMRGLLAMFASGLVFFSVLALGYTDLHHKGIYVGYKRLVPKDRVFWIALMIGSLVFFFLGDMWIWAKATLGMWVVVLSSIAIIRIGKLINGNSLFKLRSIKLSVTAAIILSIFTGLYTYILITDNNALEGDFATTINDYISDFLQTGDTQTGSTAITIENDNNGSNDNSDNDNTNVNDASSDTGAITTNTGDAIVETGEVTAGQNTSGAILSGDTTTGLVIPSEEAVETESQTQAETAASTNGQIDLSSGLLSYREIIPYLVERYDLTAPSNKKTSFAAISRSDEDYEAFNIAALKRMIGRQIKPETRVSCDTYIVLKGLAASWSVSYNGSPFVPYRNKARELGEENNCLSGEFVTKDTI